MPRVSPPANLPPTKSNYWQPPLPRVPPNSNVVSIAHINDVHAHYSPFNKLGNACTEEDRKTGHCYGGAARIAKVFQSLRARNPNNTLSLVAGDEFQGTDFYSRSKGNITATVMNYNEYDLMVTGNHEYDDGPDHLAKFFKLLKFPVVCANTNFTGVPALDALVKPYHYFEKQNLAVIGYITNTTGYISNAGPRITFSDAAPAVQRVVDELHGKGIKRIIALSHNGYHEDMEVAARTSGLSLIVGGHSHTYLSPVPEEEESGGLYPTIVKGTDGKPTYVVQAKAWGEYIGILDLLFNEEGRIANLTGMPIHLTQSIPEDPVMVNMQAGVGEATADFDQKSCQARECEAGDLVADSLLYAHRKNPEVRAALINAGGNVDTVLPFTNFIMDIRLKGSELRQMFEDIFAKKNHKTNNGITTLVQLSGLIVSYDPKRAPNNRVIDLKIRKLAPIQVSNVHPSNPDAFEPVDPNTTYTLVTLDYLVNGGDGILATPPDHDAGVGTPAEALEHYLRILRRLVHHHYLNV
ncbi:Metallo-dependent phosphatase-like protein [Syncephalis plumigaleata]|nr:Metallo-dependent phosphatase-like protein [Syncephalis plumigaleata]